MGILDNVIILLLIVGSFIAGLKLSDKYHERIEAEQEYMIRIDAAEKGCAYVAPPVKASPIGTAFMEKLKQNGRATQAIRSSKQSDPNGASAC